MTELPRIPRSSDDDTGDGIVEERRALAERVAGRALPHLRGRPVDLASSRGNVENVVGYAQVPVGLAGPLLVDTSAGTREVVVPLATTEGAIVASYSRGMGLMRAGGAARARVVKEGLTQNPILVYRDAASAVAAADTARASVDTFREITGEITSHGALVEVRPTVLGRRLVCCLVFTTGDAIGINMAAHAAELCSRELAEKTGAVERYIHGQDVEKRANSRALVEGRGRSVVCDITIPRATLVEKTRATPEAMVRILRSYADGYAHLGTHNWLVQSANALAAIMIACGQDVAYVTESATGFLDFDVTDGGDLYACACLPSLLVGTVGGGTGQGTAAECLAILGCAGDGSANVFAEIVAATVLAGDVSLMSAFCSHEFVAAHERLGRNRPS